MGKETGTLYRDGQGDIVSRENKASTWWFWPTILGLIALSMLAATLLSGCGYDASLDQHQHSEHGQQETTSLKQVLVLAEPTVWMQQDQRSEFFRQHDFTESDTALYNAALAQAVACVKREEGEGCESLAEKDASNNSHVVVPYVSVVYTSEAVYTIVVGQTVSSPSGQEYKPRFVVYCYGRGTGGLIRVDEDGRVFTKSLAEGRWQRALNLSAQKVRERALTAITSN